MDYCFPLSYQTFNVLHHMAIDKLIKFANYLQKRKLNQGFLLLCKYDNCIQCLHAFDARVIRIEVYLVIWVLKLILC